ncbi:MAG: sporulation transcription factor Spo0A [Bacilli bacterium]
MKTRVLVAEDGLNSIELYKEYFRTSKNIEIKYVAYNGKEAIDILENHSSEIDLILLDLVMPKKDGYEVLEIMKTKKILKNVIVLTANYADESIRKVSEYGVKYYLLKPFDLYELEKRIIELVSSIDKSKVIIDFHSNNIEKYLSNLLHDLGVPSHIKGFQYIKEGVLQIYKRPELLGGITKELYPIIAKKFDTSPSRVERSIRHAIEVSTTRGQWELMVKIFGHSLDIDKAKPTNSEYLVTIADKLRMEMVSI